MINTESELREAIAWFREIGAEDAPQGGCLDYARIFQFDGWWVRGEMSLYIVAVHERFKRAGGCYYFELAPWLVARLQKRCATEGMTE